MTGHRFAPLFLLLSAGLGSAQSTLPRAGEVLFSRKVSYGSLADQFGRSIDRIGDLDDDGVDDFVVGASHDDDGASNSGSVWILFMNADLSVKNVEKINQTRAGFTGILGTDNWFGKSVAALGDLDGDGVEDIAVGAPADTILSDRRVFILFMNTDGTVRDWTSMADTTQEFGRSLGRVGDLDGDGVTELMIGSGYGKAWLYYLNSNGTVKSSKTYFEDNRNISGHDEFYAIGMEPIGDFDGDGIPDMAIGASGADQGGTDLGAMYLSLMGPNGTPKLEIPIYDGLPNFDLGLPAYPNFGRDAVRLSDLDGNGVDDLAIGCSEWYGGGDGEDSGAVFTVFLEANGSIKDHRRISRHSGNLNQIIKSGSEFGISMAPMGDWNGDGTIDMAVGARFDQAGAVYFLMMNDGTLEFPTPDGEASVRSGNLPLAVQLTDLSTGTITGWLWDFGDGSTSNEQHPLHIYRTEGVFDVSLSVTGPYMMEAQKFWPQVITVGPALVTIADFSAAPTDGFAPLAVDFTDLSLGTVTGWSWDFGDGTSSSEASPTHAYLTPGTYSPSLTATGPNGIDAISQPGLIQVHASLPPVAAFQVSASVGEVPASITFEDQSQGLRDSWAWDFGDGATSNETNPTHTYTTPGTFSVSLTVANVFGSDTLTLADHVTITLPPPPTVDFTADVTSGLSTLDVQFTDTTVGAVLSHAWDFGDGQSSTLQNPLHTYAQPGLYTVALEASSLGGSSTAQRTDFIWVRPSQALVSGTSGGSSITQDATNGFEFALTNPITVARLGIRDSDGDGILSNPVNTPVALWSAAGVLLAQAIVPRTAVPEAGSFWAEIPPLQLDPGETYVLACATYAGGEPVDVNVNTVDAILEFLPLEPRSASGSTFQFPTTSGLGLGAFGPNLLLDWGNTDTDGDGLIDFFDNDDDDDGTPDASDLYPRDPTEDRDTDGDGVGDNADLFPTDPLESADGDADGVGDNSDIDLDNDGLPNDVERLTFVEPLREDFESAQGWTVNPFGTDTASTGMWEVGDPQSTFDRSTEIQLSSTTSGVRALVTQASAGSSLGSYDIDNGPTRVLSPAIFLPPGQATLSLNYTFAHLSNANEDDWLRIAVRDGATEQTLLQITGNSSTRGGQWSSFSADLSAFAGRSIHLLFEATDGGSPSLVEAAIDDILIVATTDSDGDGDGVPDLLDLDSDNDGLWDLAEAGGIDVDQDGLVDTLLAQGLLAVPADTDADGIPDYRDLESGNPTNDGSAFDLLESGALALDTSGDGRINHLDLGGGLDADRDGIDDLLDLDPTSAGSRVRDCDGDGIPDALDNDPDCNGNGIPDTCETFPDCNGNGVPDSCEPDCDGDGIPDDCDPCQPVAALSAAPGGGTAPVEVQFSDLSTGSITAWSWDFGDGGSSVLASPAHTYVTPGAFLVTLTVSGPGGWNAATLANPIVVTPPAPIASLGADLTSGLVPLSVSFSDLSVNDPTSWSWDFGDGNTSTEENPGHLYGTPGTYGVSLTVTNSGGSDSATLATAIVVLPPTPSAALGADVTTGPAPLTVQFSDLSSGSPTSWTWDFGDGNTSTEQSPGHTYAAEGTYSVFLTATNSSGSSSATLATAIVVLPPAPSAALSADVTTGLAPLTVQFTDLSSGAPTSWAWDFGDGSGSEEQHPTHGYATPGGYTVSLTATNASGSDSATLAGTIVVLPPPPTAALSADVTTGNAPLTVQFSDLSSDAPTSWSWDFGDGNDSSEQSPAHTYDAAGSYTVTLAVSNAGGGDALALAEPIVVLPEIPVADFGGDVAQGPAPLVLSFTDLSSGDITTWAWDFGDGASSFDQHPVHVYTEAGLYTVSLVVNGPAGVDSLTQIDMIEVQLAQVGIVDGSFELSTAGAAPGTPWIVDPGSAHRVLPDGLAGDLGMPTDGVQWLEISAEGSVASLPPSAPGGPTIPAIGGLGLRQSFTYAAGQSALRFDAAFVLQDNLQSGATNDWMSIDVSDGFTTINVFYRDSFSFYERTSEQYGLPMTKIERVEADLATLFATSDPTTPFTLTIQVGNGGDGLDSSRGYVDFVRCEVVEVIEVYGCGINPPGSLTVTGSARLGENLDFWIDNPLGTQCPGTSVPWLYVTTEADLAYPCGTLRPGYGMSGTNGENLVNWSNLASRVSRLSGPRWLGPGQPARVRLPLPLEPSFIGLELFAQGLMVDSNAACGTRYGLTEGVRIIVAP